LWTTGTCRNFNGEFLANVAGRHVITHTNIMPHTEKLNDLHGRTMVNIVSGETFHIYDKNSSRLPKPPGWLSLRTMEDEVSHILSRAESKFSGGAIIGASLIYGDKR
jgi:hypothetical protein